MALKYYLDQQKKLYASLIEYINDPDDDKKKFKEIINKFEDRKFGKKLDDTVENLHMLAKIWENHHRSSTFLNKIKRIILHFKDKIKQTLSNTKLFKIFQNDKLLLLFIIQNNIITVDESIALMHLNGDKKIERNYSHFFFPEIQYKLNEQMKQEIEQEMTNIYPDIFVNFEEKRQKGENDSYLCELIRTDSIEDFISYVNQKNISLSSKIKSSIFETNSFLVEKEPSLIEYAAFFGSIQIFQYLIGKVTEINVSLWVYSIHSDNAEIIGLLEENENQLSKESFNLVLKESIKCHHNNIAHYIIDTYIDPEFITNLKYNYGEHINGYSIQYYNFEFFPTKFSDIYIIFYLVEFDYLKAVRICLSSKNISINNILIRKHKRDISFVSPLNDALYQKNQEMIELILLHQTNIKKTDHVLNGCKDIPQIKIPSEIEYIGNGFFYDCFYLKNIDIPSSVIHIEDNAFTNCTSLTDIIIPSSVLSIGNFAFEGCSALKRISIPSSLTSFGFGVFKDCKNLILIEIRQCEGSKRIDVYENKFLVFKTNQLSDIYDTFMFVIPGLFEINIPSFIKTIGDCAFCTYKNIKKIIIPSSVTEIGNSVFKGCSSLTQIVFELPSSVISIGDRAFSECSLLTQITIPSSVTSIGDYTFSGCSSLTQIVFELPSSVISIGYCAFSGCSSLTQITIPSSVTSIGNDAFYGCSLLTQITIPSSVTSIEKYAFYGCSSLTQIKLSSSISKTYLEIPSRTKVIIID